ncbi:MAG: class I adenylate cyclase [Chromatiales bacterium]|nr:class I adenylate cyclase [Chromatiales bacterium]
MAEAIDFSDGIGRKELQTIRRRFQSIHRERLRRIAEELQKHQRIFIELLPLLFHINHPMLPGFAGTDTPAGIPDYNPTQALIQKARKLSRSFAYQKRARRRYNILGLYLMGSIGSIAHTSGSDLDIWVCHDPKLSSRKRNMLREKAEKLEQWAAELGLEAHIFLIDADAFKEGKRDTLSHESSGSTQPWLLLEEFYRTGVLLNGRYPLWWLVPPEEESNYRQYADMLLKKRFVDPLDVLDFGGLEDLPPEEFFGSAHWQLYKGIESPYKSILKLLLIEAYAQDYPSINWLCQEAKQAIYSGEADIDSLDPYILMYRRVENYLLKTKAQSRLDLARRCFYFKTEQHLSHKTTHIRSRWKRELLGELVDEWGWLDGQLIILDERENWKIERVLEERNRLVKELTHSYRLLTDFARAFNDQDKINPKELGLLGRKLYTALEKRPGKIDSINPGISKNLFEEVVSLHYQPGENSDVWLLYLGNINPEQALVTSPIKSTASLLEILTWCHLNQIINHRSRLHLYPEEGQITQNEVRQILKTLEQIRPAQALCEIPMQQLEAPPYAIDFSLFINIGHDPMEHLAKQGKQLTTERNDVLSFGGVHTSLVAQIDQLSCTSWGETFILHHEGSRGLLDSLCQYLRLTLLAKPDQTPPPVSTHCYASIRSRGIIQRIEALFADVTRAFLTQGLNCRYILQADDLYHVIHCRNNTFSFFQVDNREELLEILAEANTEFRPVSIDPRALTDTPLSTVYQLNREDQIQVFYHFNKRGVDLYILDENGSLFQQQMPTVDEHYLLVQQQRFLNGLLLMRNLTEGPAAHELLLHAPEFYRLEQDREGVFYTEPKTPPRHNFPDNYMELRLISENLELQNAQHYLICGDKEFNSLSFGAQLYTAVAEYVLSQRNSRQTYPIYLTGLELTEPNNPNGWNTIHLLQFKKRLEARLNYALQRVARP